MEMQGKHILVTGGSAGIGLALTRSLLQEGARVTICGRDHARLSALEGELGPSLRVICADLTKPADLERLVQDVTKEGLDILVNNAGSQTRMDFVQQDHKRPIEQEITLNLTAPILLTEALLPHLLSRPSAMVVNVTSGLALVPKQSAPVYCATKAGLRSFSIALRWQLESHGIKVVEILPPVVATQMTEGYGVGKVAPEVVAKDILAALKKGKSEVYVGKAKLLRTVARISPMLAQRMMRAR
ncbi:MAG: SDR family NAD(P)-dependent oxidoreductase [Myxococcales bacterium]|nr:SDR family NAD(P)-dependent oxidoreductase [Myxococcales bacterium]MCB9641710.1 SDR family NAD(P)-dependent oxidoreductase [Myxococcales bacterium]